MQTVGKIPNPQSLWRWDDVTNTLVHDRDVTVEKATINAETASEKIDLWNLPPQKRPPAYEKYPLEIPKDKTTVTMADIIRKFTKNLRNFLKICCLFNSKIFH